MGYHGQHHHHGHGHGGGHGHHGGGGRSMLEHSGAVSSSISNGIGGSTSSALPSSSGIKTVASSSSVASSAASKPPSVASLCNLGNTWVHGRLQTEWLKTSAFWARDNCHCLLCGASGRGKGLVKCCLLSSPLDILFLKHDSSIFRQSSNPVCGFSMMKQVRLCACHSRP